MSEQTMILGAENHLVATLTPARGSAAPRCVAVLTNSGVIPRSGPHRMNVHLARRFAAMGIPSIRFDMSGLGDSRRSSGTLPVVQQWVADTRSVMDSAQQRFGCDRFFMVGFCSGAEVAHLVALEDARMRAAVLWDLYAYQTTQSRLRTMLYRIRRAGLGGTLRKIAGRVIKLGQAAGDVKESAVKVSMVPPLEEYARRIQTLVDRRVELMISFCGSEYEWFNHFGQYRGMFGRFGFIDKLSLSYLEDCDHLITRRSAQQSFTEMVVGWLEQRVLPASAQV